MKHKTLECKLELLRAIASHRSEDRVLVGHHDRRGGDGGAQCRWGHCQRTQRGGDGADFRERDNFAGGLCSGETGRTLIHHGRLLLHCLKSKNMERNCK